MNHSFPTRFLTAGQSPFYHNRMNRLPGAIPLFLAALIILSSCNRQPSYPAPERRGDHVSIDVSRLKEEVPVFYTYRFQDKPISFFLFKLDEKILSFFDACVSCYPHRQGYRYDDDGSVTCRHCNIRFPLYKLEKGLGNCYPIKIEGRLENGKYLIPVATLEAGADKF